MIGIWVLLAGLGQDPAAATPTASTGAPLAARNQSTGRDLRTEAQEALHRWARPGPTEWEPAARQFIDLYNRLQADKQLATSVRQELLTRLRTRLMDLDRQISGRQRRDATHPATPSRITWPQTTYLAQVGPGARAAARADASNEGDPGEQLVHLIRTTIAPHTWDTRGGMGTIKLWRPGHALVVRQTDDVHDQLANLIEQLRRAGP